MTKRILTGAVQLDADVVNALDPPTAGAHVGPGVHVVIPSDFLSRIAAGQRVAGCTYASTELSLSDVTLYVSTFAEAQLSIPAVINSLPPGPIRGQAALLIVKLASAQPAMTGVAAEGTRP